ncbi:MAG: NAD(P)H-dependent flavin oxidoreductase [Candidatus Nealsonbacteria bacterium]
MLGSKLTKLLGIKYPIIQGAMAGISDSVLVSAVSNAGGLGVIGAGFLSAQWLEEEIDKTKRLTDKPFAVNLMLQNSNIPKLIEIIIEKKVPIISTGGGNPLPLIPHLKRAGIKIMTVVALTRLAKKMKESDVDVIVVEGMESGGHIGKKTTLSLVPQAKKVLENTPLVAAGGIYDGKTAAAMFVLGADGVQMGTRFLASKECDINKDYKAAILNATDEDIITVGEFTGHPVRLIKNELTEKVKKLEEKNPFPEEVRADAYSSSKLLNTDVNQAPLLAGLCAGDIKEIKTCKEIIEETIKEAEKILRGTKL